MPPVPMDNMDVIKRQFFVFICNSGGPWQFTQVLESIDKLFPWVGRILNGSEAMSDELLLLFELNSRRCHHMSVFKIQAMTVCHDSYSGFKPMEWPEGILIWDGSPVMLPVLHKMNIKISEA